MLHEASLNYHSQREIPQKEGVVTCELTLSDIPRDIQLSELYALLESKGNDEIAKCMIVVLMEAGGYRILDNDFDLLVKQRAIITTVNTGHGLKFIKHLSLLLVQPKMIGFSTRDS